MADFRLLPDMASATNYPDALVLEAAAYITAIIDREIFGSVQGQLIGFIPRTITETLDGSGYNHLVLSTPYVRSLTSVTIGGTSVGTSGVDVQGGVLRYTNRGVWTSGIGNVVVQYTAGFGTAVPADIRGAAMHGTRYRLLTTSAKSSQAARAVSTSNEAGGTTTYVIAGPDRPTGFPEVDAVIMGWKARTASFGFA